MQIVATTAEIPPDGGKVVESYPKNVQTYTNCGLQDVLFSKKNAKNDRSKERNWHGHWTFWSWSTSGEENPSQFRFRCELRVGLSVPRWSNGSKSRKGRCFGLFRIENQEIPVGNGNKTLIYIYIYDIPYFHYDTDWFIGILMVGLLKSYIYIYN